MRVLLRLVLVVGIAAATRPWWPQDWLAATPLPWPTRTIAYAGAGAAIAAWLLLRLLGRRAAIADDEDAAIRAWLSGAGFAFIDLERGWQAEGALRGERVVVRRVGDAQATRFGRPWTLLVTLPGAPREPWPFLPDQGGIVERGDGAFTVVVADLGLAGRSRLLAARLDALLDARR